MIAQETIDEVKQRCSLIEVVAEVVSLKRHGAHYVGLCPFHSEKTPSFTVKEDEGFYYCFGCNASGGVLRFVMETKALGFREAVEYLAAKAGITVKTTDQRVRPKSSGDPRVYFELNARAQDFFRRSLRNAPGSVMEYIRGRGLSQQDIEEHGIGFAPPSWTALCDHLKKGSKVDDQALVSAGLARRNDRGELFDMFRRRITIPVYVDRQRIVGFGGRILNLQSSGQSQRTSGGSDGPKYLNTPETEIYRKSQVLYGLPQAIQSIRAEKSVYVVEGYFDVIGLVRSGIKNVVATCGTAFTEEHVRKLSRITSRVMVLFDGDDAGQKAASKLFPIFLNSRVDSFAVFLPAGEDPDTYAEKIAASKGSITGALSALPRKDLFECHIESLVKAQGASQSADLGAASKGAIADQVIKLLRSVKSPIERQELCSRAALLLRLNADQLEQMMLAAGETDSTAHSGVQHSAVKPQSVAPANAYSSGTRAVGPGAQRAADASRPENARSDGTSSETQRAAQTGAEIALRSTGQSTLASQRGVAPQGVWSSLDRELLLLVMAGRSDFCERVLHDPDFVDALDPVVLAFIGSLSAAFACPEAEARDKVRTLLVSKGNDYLSLWRQASRLRESADVKLEQSFAECSRAMKRRKLDRALQIVRSQLAGSLDQESRLFLSQKLVDLRREQESLSRSAGSMSVNE